MTSSIKKDYVVYMCNDQNCENTEKYTNCTKDFVKKEAKKYKKLGWTSVSIIECAEDGSICNDGGEYYSEEWV